MNAFEKILLGIVSGAAQIAPIFVHSQQGILVLNASETLFANILQQFQTQQASAPASAPAVVETVQTTTTTMAKK